MNNRIHIGWRGTAALLFLAMQAVPAVAEQPLSIFARAIGDGSARGEATGEMFDQMRQTTRSSAPFFMKAKVIKRFSQEGCARLSVELSQADVPTKDGRTAPFSTTWEMNVCVDGTPPAEGRDPDAMKKLESQLGEVKK